VGAHQGRVFVLQWTCMQRTYRSKAHSKLAGLCVTQGAPGEGAIACVHAVGSLKKR
jgi:hypothetical protein